MNKRKYIGSTGVGLPYGHPINRRERERSAKRRRMGPKITPRPYVARTPGGQIVAENHYFDSERSLNIVSCATSWAGCMADPTPANCLFSPVQGDDISQRQGRRVFLKKIRINGSVAIPTQPGPDPYANIRIVVVQDMQTNGSQMTATQLLSSGAAADGIHMFQSTLNFGRFKILKDKTFNMADRALAGVAGAFQEQFKVAEFKFSLKPNCYINYNSGNTNSISDVVDNSFHILAGATDSASSPVLNYKCRCVFTP